MADSLTSLEPAVCPHEAVTVLHSSVKVDSETHTVYVDEHLEDLDGVDELRAELSEHQPRFVIYSCKIEHSDGRISYPMVFIFSTPKGATRGDLSSQGRARLQD